MNENVPQAEPDVFATLLGLIIGIVLTIVVFWKIFSKAGYSGWLSILMAIPLVNLITLFYLAFAHWPVLKELERLRRKDSELPPSKTT